MFETSTVTYELHFTDNSYPIDDPPPGKRWDEVKQEFVADEPATSN